MNKEQFKIIAKKYSENQCNDQEKSIIEAFFSEMQKKQSADAVLLSNKKKEKISRAVYAQTIKSSKPSFRLRIIQVAAIAVLFLGISFLIKQLATPKEIIQITNSEEKKEVFLQDGSIVVLNKNSTLSYPEEFGKTRSIKLTGEAYFKVKSNPKKPFIVTMHDMRLKVLGTSFNINSYSKNPTKVSVLTGIVDLKSNSGESVILTKNQHADFTDSSFRITRVESVEKIAWTKNNIVLEQTTLGETAKILENNYNVTIDFEDKELEKLIISGKFNEEKLENILASIAFVKKLKIDYLTKNQIIIRRDTTNY